MTTFRLLAGSVCLLASSASLLGQGCVCSRQNPSVLGGTTPYLRKGEWQVVAVYRHFVSDRHYQGRDPYPQLDPFGPNNTQNQLNLDISYGFARRFSASLNVPLVINTFSLNRVPPGGTVQEWTSTHANGLGDISVRGNYWIFKSREGDQWNIGVSAGLKAPTGKAGVTDTIYGRTVPVDVSIQPGDKAWAPIASLQAFRQFNWITFFGSASYMFNPRNTTGVPVFFQTLANPKNTFPNSSSDQFAYHGGASFRTAPKWPVPVIAYRITGVPVFDVFGPSNGFRRPGTIGMVEPGLSYSLKGHTVTVTIPITAYVNIKDSPMTSRIEDATVPKYSFTLTYLKRFRP